MPATTLLGPMEPTQLAPIPTSNGELYGEAFTPAKATRPKGIVVVSHGYAEHCGRYRELAHVIVAAGWAALTYDVRGHGKSPGVRGFVEAFHEYTDDLTCVVKVARGLVAAPAPLVLLGHSHGSLITLRAACGGTEATALIASSPYLGLRMAVPRWKKLLARIASRLAPTLAQPNNITSGQLTSDQAMQAAHDADPLNFGVATSRWFVESSAAQAYVAANASKITVPSTWIVGGADPIADPARSRRVAQTMKQTDYHELAGFLHEVFNETGRAQAFELVTNALAAIA